jgi:outer membrane cobalamin receptor
MFSKKNTTLTFLIILSFIIDYSVYSNNINSNRSLKGNISGFIYNKHTGCKLPDADIIIQGTKYGTASGDGGFYSISEIPQNEFEILVKMMGYKSLTKTITVSSKTKLDFALIPKPVEFVPIMVTATKSAHLQSKITVSSEILTRNKIEENNGDVVGEVIESSVGIFNKNYGGFAGLQTPSIRGSNPDQVLVLLDGQRLNPAQGGGVDMNYFPIEILERIEIIRGGHSALLGTDAIGGVIHLLSRESQYLKGFNYGIKSTIGSFGTQNISFHGSHEFGLLNIFINYNTLQSDGNFKYFHSETGEKNIRQNNNFRGNNLFFKGKYNINNNNMFRFIYQNLKTNRGIAGPTQWPSTLARRKEFRDLFTFQIENQITSNIKTKEHLYHHIYTNNYINPEYFTNDKHKNIASGLDIQTIYTINPTIIFNAGIELRQDYLKTTKYSNQERITQSIFLQSEINHTINILGLTTEWKWIPAIRFDNYSDITPHTSFNLFNFFNSPKLGALISTGNNISMTVKGNVGTSLRIPTFDDLYWPEEIWPGFGGSKGNSNLTPEIGNNFDFGFILKMIQPINLQMELTYYQNDIKDLIIWETDKDWISSPRNIGTANIKGLENRCTFRLPNNRFYFEFVNTWMEAKDNTPGSLYKDNRLVYRPDNKYDINIGFYIKSLKFNFNFRSVGKRYTNPENTESLKSYKMINCNIRHSFAVWNVNIDTKLSIQNLLDSSIYILRGYPIPGREIRFSFGIQY